MAHLTVMVVQPVRHCQKHHESGSAQEQAAGVLADEVHGEDRCEDEQAKASEPGEVGHPRGKLRSLAVGSEAQRELGKERRHTRQQAGRVHDV